MFILVCVPGAADARRAMGGTTAIPAGSAYQFNRAAANRFATGPGLHSLTRVASKYQGFGAHSEIILKSEHGTGRLRIN